MNEEFIRVTEDCSKGALSGTLTFPEILQALSKIGVERYHADYSRHEITYYGTDGMSHVVASEHPTESIGLEFLPAVVAAAVKQSQQGEHTYVDFLRKTMDAGCVGYFVQITGGQVIYFGRTGEAHVERFPVSTTV